MSIFTRLLTPLATMVQTSERDAENAQFLAVKTRIVKRFLSALTALALLASSAFLALPTTQPQAVLQWHVLFSLSVVVFVCGLSYVLLAKGKPVEATWLTIAVLIILLLDRVLVTGMGVRMPSLYLWILPIVLGYFVLSVSVGRGVMLLACALSVGLYLGESFGLVPGTVGDRFPDVYSSLFVWLMVFICGYFGAEGMYAHNDLVFSIAEEKNRKLKDALADIEIVEGTQLRLLNMISTHTREPSALLIAIADTIETQAQTTAQSEENIPVASIKFITNSLLKDLDAAIADIELDTQRVMSGK